MQEHHRSPPPKSSARIPEMDAIPGMVHDEPSSSSLWDWSQFLDFNIDDQLTLPWEGSDHPNPPELPSIPPPATESENRVRKRDPRLTCSNYLAGIVPCACPELDELLAEEERVHPGKKKARTARAPAVRARCQVPGCEADISELKGYHRRHRVCLGCANATSVVLDGQSKRYCQQCGKFHILSDFDEGKRSCRRKLERHNNRRRRKPTESSGAIEKESQGALSAEDTACDDETVKDSICLSSRDTEREVLLESEDGPNSTLCSARDSQNIQGDSGISYVASGETQMGGIKADSKSLSPSCNDNKSAYSSMCPTGRISFKLYDWNPAEFPRRLRHQIFQWLSSMPVELEGYIRPGCTILTVFLAMPKLMWVKLFQDPSFYIDDFVVKPGKMLSGRGTLFVYLNDMIFHVGKDKVTMMEIKAEVQPPKLHFVHPTCFEAGQPIEFIACGSNLSHPQFRLLVSFAGKYLAHDYCVQIPCEETAGNTVCGFDHQLYKIYIPPTETELFGPAFVEVDNQCGISNFIPILIGDKETCAEMKAIQQRLDTGLEFPANSSLADACDVSGLRQGAFSEILVDIGWLLKEPTLENMQYISSLQMERFDCLLNFLIQSQSTIILRRVLQHINIWMENMKWNGASNGSTEVHMRLREKMDYTRDVVSQKFQKEGDLVGYPVKCSSESSSPRQGLEYGFSGCFSTQKQEIKTEIETAGQKRHLKLEPTSNRSETVPLLNGEVVMNVNLIKEQPRKYRRRSFLGNTSPSMILVVAAVAVCFGICAVILHPQKAVKFAVTIRRCLFDDV